MSLDSAGAMLLSVLLLLIWTLIPVKADKSCSTLKHLENGRTFFRYNGLYVTFSCNPGFRIHGHRTSSCVSGQWAREPPLCVGSGCPRPTKLLHGTTLMSPDGSLVRFICDNGFRLLGSPMLYCRGKSWNGSTPLCKESDIMGSFQFKQTSLSKPGLDVNQEMLSLRKHFNNIASTSGEKMKSVNAGHLLKDPHNVMHDEVTTPTIKETDKIKRIGEQTEAADPIDQRQFPTVPLTLNLSLFVKPTESTILVTSSTNNPKKISTPYQMSSLLPKAHDERNSHLTSTRQNYEYSRPNTNVSQNASILDAPTGLLKMHKESKLSENFRSPLKSTLGNINVSQSPGVLIKINTAVYPTSNPDTPESKNEMSPSITIKDFLEGIAPFDPATIHDFSATGPEDLESGTGIPTSSILTLQMMPLPDVPTESPQQVHHANRHTKKGPEMDTEFLSKNHTSLISDDLKTAKFNQSVSNQLPNSTPQANLVYKTSKNLRLSPVQTGRRRPVCPYPPVPSHGTFFFRTIADPAPFQYKHYVQFACYAGHTLADGDLYSFCLQDGSWSGVTPKCVESTPCSLNHGGCSQVCQVNGHDQTECLCKPGFMLLEDQRTCRDLNECTEGLHGCQQVCENSFGSYRCTCNLGFQLSADGVSCTDVDECLLPSSGNHCVFGCINTSGSFHCQCPSGYTVNITGHCTDIDECMEEEGRESCLHTCVNTEGSFYCTCLNGFQLAGDGRACVPECPPGYHKLYNAPEGNATTLPCVDIDECLEMVERKRDEQHRCAWKCVNLPGTHHCICPRGFILHPNKYFCKDIDECTVRNGICSHICVNHQGGFKCACPENYRLSSYDRRKCLPVQNAQKTHNGVILV